MSVRRFLLQKPGKPPRPAISSFPTPNTWCAPRRPPRWCAVTIPTSISLLLIYRLARGALFWASYSWDSRKTTSGQCHRPKVTASGGYFEQECADEDELMKDRELPTAWKVDLMLPWSDGMVLLLSSDAQPSQIIDIRPKFENQDSSKERSSRSMWLKMGTKPVWGTWQLLIFLSCVNNGAIDMFTRRVGCQQVTSFVAPPRTFHPFLGIGVGVAISWGGLDVEIEPRGAESRSILPRYVSKNGTACVSDIPIMWNPLHSHLLRSKLKCSSFSSISPFIYHFRWRYINKAPIIDGKASNRMLHTHSESL